MGKIHTHYDNLKVSRMAPQEVIRAAYKALSQKYHPDKNAGDEKAARIMAIVNHAYDILSDTQRRREHDEWIAAEEWEIDWLESTRHEDGRGGDKGHDADRWNPEPVEDSPRARADRTRWKWAGAVVASLAVGWAGGTMMAEPNWLASAWGGKVAARIAAEAHAAEVPETKPEQRDIWAASKPATPDHPPRPVKVKVVAMSHVVLPSAGGDCEMEGQTLVAPNGEPWPEQSGYVEGFTIGNRGDDIELMVDNGNNASAVFVKVYDVDRRANVRYAYVQAHDKLMVDNLANGKYEVRYQDLDASGAACTPETEHAAPRTVTASADLTTVSLKR